MPLTDSAFETVTPQRATTTLVLVAVVALFCSAIRAADIVCITSEDPDNYDAVTFLNGFADRELRPAGHRVTVVVGNQPKPTHFEGLVAAVRGADLLVVFVRRATPPQDQLDAVRAHLRAGKPLVGIRTANHGFIPSPNAPPPPAACVAWPEFSPEVLGCRNAGYETKGLPYTVARHPDVSADEPLLAGVDVGSIRGHQSLYLVLPLAADVRPLLVGTAKDREPPQPVAWTRTHDGEGHSRIFYTSLGAPEDVIGPPVRRLLLNAVNWALEGGPRQ